MSHIGNSKKPLKIINSSSEGSICEAGEEFIERPIKKPPPPPGHYSYKRPKCFIDTDLESDHDPKEKQNREFWDRNNIFNSGEGDKGHEDLGELGLEGQGFEVGIDLIGILRLNLQTLTDFGL